MNIREQRKMTALMLHGRITMQHYLKIPLKALPTGLRIGIALKKKAAVSPTPSFRQIFPKKPWMRLLQISPS
jgi:hypothetical protein